MSPTGKPPSAARNLVLPKITVAVAPTRHSMPWQSLAPPGVGHLLLWTAGCACYLTIMQVLSAGALRPRGMVLLVLQCFGSGAAIACVVFTLVQRVRGIRLEWSPGHWLLLALGITLLGEACGLRSYPGAATMLLCWMALLPTLSRKLSIRWRLAFGCLVLLYALPLILPMLDMRPGSLLARPWFEPLAATGVVVSVYLRERFLGVPHVWLHKVGVAVMVWNFMVWATFRYLF